MARAKARHPELGDRGHCIIPGANPPDFPHTPYQRGKHFVIGHFGSLADTRNLEFFLQGMQRFTENTPQSIDNIRLHLYGGGVDAVSAHAIKVFPHSAMIEKFGRLETDPVTGESGRVRVIKRMNASDCLLLLHGTVPFCEEYIPSKMYEYLWTRRPILALVWRNPQMELLLRELGHVVVNANDPEEISQALATLYARWLRNDLPDLQANSPYSTEAATRQIVALANDCLQHRPQPAR